MLGTEYQAGDRYADNNLSATQAGTVGRRTRLHINAQGELRITANDAAPICLDAAQTALLGDFLLTTQSLWRNQ